MRIHNILLPHVQIVLKSIFTYKTHFSKRNSLFNRHIYRFSSFKMSTEMEQTEKFTRLPVPEKGLCDKYKYSVIRLKNGLTALLISDVENLISLDALSEMDDKLENRMDNSEAEESGDESGSSSDSDMDVDESVGEKKSDEKLAALSLTIGVGSFADGDIPGLAHLLEHMVFMGSAKYPEENDFDAFLASRGGSSNAQTEYETTTFYFDVPEPHLNKSMDIFANFFVEPLLKRDSIQGEMEIVDSEFQSSVLNDQARLEQLLSTACDEANPAGKFVWGNLATLRHGVEENRLYASLHELRRTRYVANHMTLALQARLDLTTLEAWVVEHFSAIPTSSTPPPPPLSLPSPFSPPLWHRLFTVSPVETLNELHLHWWVPPLHPHHRAKPLDIASWYLGHESAGGLVSQLRDQRFLASEVEAGYENSGFECNSLYAIFTVNITLTDKGVSQIKQIVDLVFEYIALLASQPITHAQFQEIATITRTGFDYRSERSAVDYVSELTENMQLYPPSEYLTGGTQITEYRPDLVSSFLRLLTPARLNMTLVSSLACAESRVHLDLTEPWFGTRYRADPIQPRWIEDWEQATPGPYFHLPGPNEFITTDFSLLPVEHELKYPEKILQNESTEVWFKQTTKYQLPRCVVYFVLELPLLTQSLANSVLIDVFLDAVQSALNRHVYNAYLTQHYVSIGRGEYGIHLSLNSFSQHADKFLSIVLHQLKNADLTEELFLVSRDTVLRSYVNQLKDSEVLRRSLRMAVLLPDSFLVQDKHRVLRDEITYDKLCSFRDTLFHRMYVKSLAMGNLTRDSTLSLVASLTRTIPFTPLDPGERREIQITRLEEREKVLRVRSLHATDPNCTVLNYYQSRRNQGELRESCVLEILVEIISEPLFDTLRTKQKLGYHVNATVRDTFGVLGLSVLVESQMSKHAVEEVEARIHGFISDYVRENETSIRDKYEEYIGTLVKKKKMVELNLKEESVRHFEEIKTQDYLFDRQERELELIQSIELGEVLAWVDLNIVEKPKKLSIQIMGTENEIPDTSPSKDSKPSGQQSGSNEHKRKHSNSDDRESSENSKQLPKTADHVQNGGNSANRLAEPNENNLVDSSQKNHALSPKLETTESPSKNTDVPSIPSIDTHKAPSIGKDILSLHGNKTPSIDANTPEESGGYIAIKYLVPNEGDDRFIKDIEEYRKTLELYPVMKLK